MNIRTRHLLNTCLLATTNLFANGAMAETDNQSVSVSLINLIATPERYHGKLVHVTGYISLGVEDNSICPMKVKISSKDCIWINIDSGPYETKADEKRILKKMTILHKFKGKVATIKAKFDQENQGHFGSSSGALTDIVDIYGDTYKAYSFRDKFAEK